MASAEVTEVISPRSKSHAAMAAVMARILAGGSGGEGREQIVESGTRIKRRRYQECPMEVPSNTRFQHGGVERESSGSDSDEGDEQAVEPTLPSIAQESGPVDVVKQCHRSPLEFSAEEERLLQSMATRGGVWM